MQQKSQLPLFALSIIFALLFCTCKKGDTGPAGPAGPTGATGTQGPKGDTGTAIVIASAWLDVIYAPDTIRINNILDTIGFKGSIAATKLTNSIISSGEMKVYINIGTSANPDVFVLPYNDIYSGLDVIPEFFIQRIALYSNANVSTFTRDGLKYLQYRYILIPSTVNARKMPFVDWNDYNKVKAYFELRE